MEIIGLGVDLADTARVRKLLHRSPESFKRRCFTDHEWAYAQRFTDPSERLAARFAGKEAVMKAMFTGWRRIPWRDIEIMGGGPPRVRVYGAAADRADRLGITEFKVTITHTVDSALVFVVAVGEHV